MGTVDTTVAETAIRPHIPCNAAGVVRERRFTPVGTVDKVADTEAADVAIRPHEPRMVATTAIDARVRRS